MKKNTLTGEIALKALGDLVFAIRGDLKGSASDTSLMNGMYGVSKGANPGVSDLPSGEEYGSLLIFKGLGLGNGGNPIVQIFISAYGANYMRKRWGINTNFRPWQRISVIDL